jgi:hypothetical protein
MFMMLQNLFTMPEEARCSSQEHSLRRALGVLLRACSSGAGIGTCQSTSRQKQINKQPGLTEIGDPDDEQVGR